MASNALIATKISREDSLLSPLSSSLSLSSCLVSFSSFFTDYDFVFDQLSVEGAAKEAAWNTMLAAYAAEHPDLHAEFQRRVAGHLPHDWMSALPQFTPADPAKATRQLSAEVLNALAKKIPELIGGSADLTPSNLTDIKGAKDFQKDSCDGRYLRFGVREHGSFFNFFFSSCSLSCRV
jgi:transketolase